MAYADYNPWTEVPDRTFISLDALMERVGWESRLGVGPTDAWMWISTWSRTVDGVTQYAAMLDDGNGDAPLISTDSSLELMDLIARWAPIVQASSVASFIAGLGVGESSDSDLVTRVTTKVLRALE